jgi:hypothetical protein
MLNKSREWSTLYGYGEVPYALENNVYSAAVE